MDAVAASGDGIPYSRLDSPRGGYGAILRRPVVILLGVVGIISCYLVLSPSTSASVAAGYSTRLHESLDKLDWRTHSPPRKTAKEVNAAGVFDEFDGPAGGCNPFQATGRLHVDESNPTSNIWEPFDHRCRPSNYMAKLFRPEGDVSALIPARGDKKSTREFLPWLMNKTVVIHGDSIDRFHLKDFCAFVGGKLTLITQDHPASPKPYHEDSKKEVGMTGEETAASKAYRAKRVEKEKFWESRPSDGQVLTNPWLCDVPEYGFTLINVFTWGLQGAEEFFETERWYHPPGEHIVSARIDLR